MTKSPDEKDHNAVETFHDVLESVYDYGYISGMTAAFWSFIFVFVLALLTERMLKCMTSFRPSRE